MSGMHLSGAATAWQLTGSSLDAANHVGQPAQVTTKEISTDATPGTISAAPLSVTVYRFPLAQ
jgi:alpha-N-arabinofuranosidase